MNVIDVYSKTTTKEGFKYSLMKAFCDGVNKIKDQNWIANLVDNYEMSNGDYAFCFNYQRDIPTSRPGLDLRKKIIQRYEPPGKIFYYDSNVLVSYEKVKHHPITSYVRIAYGNVYPDKAKYFNNHPSPERWNIMKERLKIKIKDYDKSGDQIYICCNRGSGGYSAFGQNAAQWAIETTQQLRQYTKRPIVIRLHSGQGYPTFNDDAHRLYEFTKKLKDVDVHSPNGKYPSLLEEIKKSYAVVIFTSTSGAPAIIEGKPLFVTHQSSYLYSMNAGHLSEIENPNLNLDRNNFLYGLGESHWTLQDIENGLYFKKFLENII
jgi:hypothetical protein